MQMTDRQIEAVAAWASSIDAISAIWLFGSRSRNQARPDSDYDFAVELRPKIGNHDWAFGDYVFEEPQWKAELRSLVGGEVSLVPWRDYDLEGPFDPRVILLWKRK